MVTQILKRTAKKIFNRFFHPIPSEVDALYRILYDQANDLEQAKEIGSYSTEKAFSDQWSQYSTGEYLLSDPKFRDQVDDILSSQEILLKKEWFAGKKVLDAGCGNGRWSYGFSKLNADVTCVDVNLSALGATQKALAAFSNRQQFIQSPLEEIHNKVEKGSYDLGFSWGVLHHCVGFNRALQNVADAIKEGGLIYLYLYGRESVPISEDLALFKKRIIYRTLLSPKERYEFLLKEAGGDVNKVHNVHDVYAPLINRRFTFEEVSRMLTNLGFSDITRTIVHKEVFVRAVKGKSDYSKYTLPPKSAPYWFEEKR